jgi:hypothetical protein
MTSVKKKGKKYVRKAWTEVIEKAKEQKEKSKLVKTIHIQTDEFVEHKPLEEILVEFANQAVSLEQQYRIHKKQMIRDVAQRLEEELNAMGKSELICRISTELISILKQIGVGWSPKYIRKCLDKKYKDPTNQANALARERHSANKEQLQQQQQINNSVQQMEDYTVNYELEMRDTEVWWDMHWNEEQEAWLYAVRFKIHVKPSQRSAVLEIDKEWDKEQKEKYMRKKEEEETASKEKSKRKQKQKAAETKTD